MTRAHPRLSGLLLLSALFVSSIATGPAQARTVTASVGTVVASGLDHPKNFAFGTDGSLYVAESGHSDGTCPPPTQTQSVTSGANTGAVTRIAPDGTVTKVATGLRSLCDAGDYLGPSAVLPSAHGLLILQGTCVGAFPIAANASCAVSQPLVRLSAGGPLQTVAQFISHGNGDTPNVPDEDPFALAQGPHGVVYVSDGGNNAIWRFRPTAQGAQRISQPLVQFPHDPTVAGLTVGSDGAVYVAIFGKAFWQTRAGWVGRVTPTGQYTIVRSGLTTPIGVAVSPAGTLYILQYASAFVLKPFPHFLPNTGVVYRSVPGSALIPVIRGLNFPTSIGFGPNGNLYVTNDGTGVAPMATGQIISFYVGA